MKLRVIRVMDVVGNDFGVIDGVKPFRTASNFVTTDGEDEYEKLLAADGTTAEATRV